MCGCEPSLDIFVPGVGISGRGSINCWAACCCYKCQRPETNTRYYHTNVKCWKISVAFYLVIAVLWTLGFGFGSWAVWAGYEAGGCDGVERDKIKYPFDCTPSTVNSTDPYDHKDASYCCIRSCTTTGTNSCVWNTKDEVFTYVVVSILAAMAVLGLLMIVSGSMLCEEKKKRSPTHPETNKQEAGK